MSVELATAYVQLVPSAQGIAGKIASELAPVEGAAAATGARAGTSMAAGLSNTLTSKLPSFLPTASLGPVGALLGVGLVAGFGAALIGIGKEFGAARRQIAVDTGQTGAELEGTFASVKRVFADVPASLHQVTTAVDLLRQRGVPLGAQLDNLAKQEIELAHITKTDLGTNVESTTALFAKFQVGLRDQPAALDAIFKASQQSGKGLADLLDNMKSGATSLSLFGFGIKESAALIATLERAGVNVQPALAGLKKAFGQLAKEGQDPKKALHDLIAEFQSGTDPAKAMGDAIKLFGARSGVELANAIKAGKFDVKDLLKTITDGKGGILETADANRTLGDRFAILKNQASLALEPLASAVWKQVKEIIKELIPPATDIATALGRLGAAAAPAAAIFGGALLGAFKLASVVLGLVATGIDVIASALEHIPTPILVAVPLVALLADEIFLFSAATSGATLAATAFGVAMDFATGPIGITIAALALVGAAFTLFGSGESAASKEAKDLGKALFDTSNTAGIFSGQIGGAKQALTQFLTQQDAAGKLKDLDSALEGTGKSLQDVAAAAGGSAKDFGALRATLVDTSGLNAVQKSLVGVTGDALDTAAAARGLSISQREAVAAVSSTANALDTQRKAFVESADSQIKFRLGAGQISQAQADMATSILHSNDAVGGAIPALDALNGAMAKNAAAADKAQLAQLKQSGGLTELKASILDGTVATDDATSAASRFGLSLDATKQIISDTQAELKAFVDKGLAGFPTTSDAVNTWSDNIKSAFQNVVDAAHSSPEEVKKAQSELAAAVDPKQVVANLQAQATAIVGFTTSIKTLLSRGLTDAARALIEDPNKGAAATFAKSLVDNPTLAREFNTAQQTVTTKTAELQAFLQGPAAQQLLAGSTADAQAISTGFATTKIAPPVRTEVQKTLSVLSQKEIFSRAAGDTAAAASFGFQRRMLTTNATAAELGRTVGAVSGASTPIGAAAGSTASHATGQYAANLNLPGATSASATTAAQTLLDPNGRIGLANAARHAGSLVGVAFDQGIRSAIRDGATGIEEAARAAATAAERAAKQQLGISSPSKVGAEIGESFVEGVALGLTGSDAAELAARAHAIRVAEAAKIPASGVSTSAVHELATVGATATQNVTAAATAQDWEKLVSRIERAVAQARPISVNGVGVDEFMSRIHREERRAAALAGL